MEKITSNHFSLSHKFSNSCSNPLVRGYFHFNKPAFRDYIVKKPSIQMCSARRELPRDSSNNTASSQVWKIPLKLLKVPEVENQAQGSPLTVYTLRVMTASTRGSALSEAISGVNVCLISKSGDALMHRIPPINDPAANRLVIQQICESVDDSVGANCPVATSVVSQWQSSADSSKNYVKRRFQEGSVDEVIFLGPELGPLQGILVGVEAGTWLLSEIDVQSSRTNHIDRFDCGYHLGLAAGEGAVFLEPTPPGGVKYGSGDKQKILTKEESVALQTVGMVGYSKLKSSVLSTTAMLTLGGTGIAAVAGGPEAALPFAFGGATGVAYQWMLQWGVDSMLATTPRKAPLSAASMPVLGDAATNPTIVRELEAAASRPPQLTPVQKLLGSAAARTALLATAALGAIMLSTPGTGSSWQMLSGLLGFLTYKVALVTTSFSGQTDEPQGARELTPELNTRERGTEY